MEINYPEVGICGLSCRLCPTYHTQGESKCGGCKSEYRMRAGCPFITCAVKKKGIEFCWLCEQSDDCEKWGAHRAFGREHDTFVCYQKLEENIEFIKKYGIETFQETQLVRKKILNEMLSNFNEGRSKRHYCIAVTVFEISELEDALTQARNDSDGLELKDRSKVLHSLLDNLAKEKHFNLSLRK